MRGVLTSLRARWTELLAAVLGLVVIVVVFVVVLPGIADYGAVAGALRGVPWIWVAALAIVGALNVVTFAPAFMVALPGLGFRSALAVTLTSTASTYIAPGGPALGVTLSFAMLSGWGFARRAVTLAVSVVTVWNQFMIFGTPLVALALLTAAGEKNPLLQTASFVGAAVFGAIICGFAAVLLGERQAQRVGDVAAQGTSSLLRLVRRHPVTWSGEAFVRFRRDAVGLLARRWHALTLATLAGHLSVYLVMLVSLRALGVTGGEVSLVESFAAWALVRVLGSIPITPGGFGIVEVGLTGALIGFGGNETEVVTAVLVYRFVTVAPPLVLGVLFGSTWRRHHPGWETAPEAEP